MTIEGSLCKLSSHLKPKKKKIHFKDGTYQIPKSCRCIRTMSRWKKYTLAGAIEIHKENQGNHAFGDNQHLFLKRRKRYLFTDFLMIRLVYRPIFLSTENLFSLGPILLYKNSLSILFQLLASTSEELFGSCISVPFNVVFQTFSHLTLYYLINIVCPVFSNSIPAHLRRCDSVLIILYRIGVTAPTFAKILHAKHLKQQRQ